MSTVRTKQLYSGKLRCSYHFLTEQYITSNGRLFVIVIRSDNGMEKQKH